MKHKLVERKRTSQSVEAINDNSRGNLAQKKNIPGFKLLFWIVIAVLINSSLETDLVPKQDKKRNASCVQLEKAADIDQQMDFDCLRRE